MMLRVPKRPLAACIALHGFNNQFAESVTLIALALEFMFQV